MMRRLLVALILAVVVGLSVAFSETRPAVDAPPPPPKVHPATRAELARQLLRERRQHRRAMRRLRRLITSRADVREAIALAAEVYHVSFWQMMRVARCESGLSARGKNRKSTASGLFQFLNTTWAGTPFARFSVWSPYANALAAAYVVRTGHGWGPWRESRPCHHL